MTTRPIFDLQGRRIFVAGATGMVGRAVSERLEAEGCAEILKPTRRDLDLTRQSDVEAWMRDHRPDAVVVAAARVGGIKANETQPADFIYENLIIETNLVHAAYLAGVAKLLFLGSSCIYPKHAPQPIPEDALLTGPLEPTNEWYAVAKIAGIKLCQAYRRQHGCDFISAMPTNLYGPGDNFELSTSHVLPALIRKAVDNLESGETGLDIWGTGTPRREFLHVRDCADALVFLLKNYSDEEHVNVGSGADVTILELARLILEAVGLSGEVRTDPSKPDGTPRKLMSGERLRAMGWTPATALEDGVRETIDWYRANRDSVKLRA
ncbi:MAG: GDP-L-fucose synthase [Pseudomonadota bacterium]